MTEQEMSRPKRIGGFFEMALPGQPVQHNVLASWDILETSICGFSNARSALAALIGYIKPDRIFLPAYVCQSVADGCSKESADIVYYGLDPQLEPDTDFLAMTVRDGDVVLGVNYFGRAPGREFQEFVRAHPRITFIEDCAQALDTGQGPWGDWRLFSPRKLMGVADGGYITAVGSEAQPFLSPSDDGNPHVLDLWAAALLRLEDTQIDFNSAWHQANQQREKAEQVRSLRISRLSHELLLRLDASEIATRRRENYLVLHQSLSSMAFLADPKPTYVPFGFPIRLSSDRRDVLFRELIANGIFPGIHWPDLPSPKDAFPLEHRLAKEILTLPCDQRYGVDDMATIASLVEDILK